LRCLNSNVHAPQYISVLICYRPSVDTINVLK
jgi:hypothetical protein